jgi:hypothetical protein
LKDKYKYGVVGDKNDIETIIQVITKLYNDSKQTLATVSDILKYQKNDSSGTSEVEKKLSNIDSKTITLERLSDNLDIQFNQQINNIIVRIKRDNDLIIKHILTPSQFQELKDIIIFKEDVGEDYNMVRKILFEYDEFLKSVLQMVDYVITLMDSSIRDMSINASQSAQKKLLKIEELYVEPKTLLQRFDYFDGLNEISRIFNRFKRQNQEEFLNRYNAMREQQPQELGQGIKGKGLIMEQEPKRTRGRPRKPENVGKVKSEKIERYVGFGINEINKHKLSDKSIFCIRRKNKSNYPNLPSRIVDSPLKNVILDITGGKIPTFKDINDMSEEDKNYLHKILSISGLSDKFSIPTPALDKINKDIHDFEVMKGEILSGNDSKDLVRKFKLNVAKLSRIGVLPKREVNELLILLADLNY